MDPAVAAGIEDPWLAQQFRTALFVRLKDAERKWLEEQESQDQERDLRAEHGERLDRAQKILLGR